MESSKVKKFLEQCVHEYSIQMDIHLSVADAKSELREAHGRVKKMILSLHKSKWNRIHGYASQPENLRDLVEQQIEQKYQVYQDKLLANLGGGTIPEKNEDSNIPALGIDLGTTMCCVMIYRNGNLEVVPNRAQSNSRTTASYVGFLESGAVTFGKTAKDQSHRLSETTIYDAKRMIGRAWSDPDLQKDIENWPFDVVNEHGHVKVKCWNKSRYPHEISGILLNQLRSMTEAYLQLPNGSITKAVVTVPAYFTEPQRRATRDAAESAGLQVLNILSEPTAAAIAYNWNRTERETKTVLVYDLGGGTFDVTLANVGAEGVTVLGVSGDTHLGGQDIDQLLMDYCIDEFLAQENVNLKEGVNSDSRQVRDKARRALSRLKHQCEKVKEQLSSGEEAEVDIPCIYQALDLVVPISREKLEQLSRPLIQKTIDIVERAINDAKSKGVQGKEQISEIILVGGSTRMPLVIKMLEEYFGCPVFQQINPDEAVACGAAIQATMLSGKLKGELKEFQVKDVTPLSLGIECADDATCVLIPRNTALPFTYEKIFATDQDYQTSLRITCLQGEESRASQNKRLGEFYIYGISPRPAGMEKIIVTMNIDSMGILEVKATSLTGCKSKAIKITAMRLDSDGELER